MQISIDISESKILKSLSDPAEYAAALKNGAIKVSDFLRKYYREKNAKEPNKLSSRRTNFWFQIAQSVQAPFTRGSEEVVTILDGRIAQKIYTDTPIIDTVQNLEAKHVAVDRSYEAYFDVAKTYKTIMPNLKGMPAMDALVLLENMGMKVRLQGTGKVVKQSVSSGVKLKPKQTIILELS